MNMIEQMFDFIGKKHPIKYLRMEYKLHIEKVPLYLKRYWINELIGLIRK
jgi:hypothetical protein